MPIYEYEHLGLSCSKGVIFEIRQSLQDQPLTLCPYCQEKVRKIISCPNINTPKTNAELKDLGFTKLVKRDNGVYENVTARQGENRVVHTNRPSTFPNLRKTIRD